MLCFQKVKYMESNFVLTFVFDKQNGMELNVPNYQFIYT